MTHNIKWLVYLAVPVVPLIIWLNKQPTKTCTHQN